MDCLDHLLPFVDNGGRRSYIERRRNTKLARIPDRRTQKERRLTHDRRKTIRYETALDYNSLNQKRLSCFT